MYQAIETPAGWQIVNTKTNRNCGQPFVSKAEAIQACKEANNAVTGAGAGE